MSTTNRIIRSYATKLPSPGAELPRTAYPGICLGAQIDRAMGGVVRPGSRRRSDGRRLSLRTLDRPRCLRRSTNCPCCISMARSASRHRIASLARTPTVRCRPFWALRVSVSFVKPTRRVKKPGSLATVEIPHPAFRSTACGLTPRGTVPNWRRWRLRFSRTGFAPRRNDRCTLAHGSKSVTMPCALPLMLGLSECRSMSIRRMRDDDVGDVIRIRWLRSGDASFQPLGGKASLHSELWSRVPNCWSRSSARDSLMRGIQDDQG